MKKDSEITRMFRYAGNRHWLTIAGMVLAGVSTVLSMVPFICVWFVVRDLLNALVAGDISLATRSSTYAWWAVGFSVLSILLYFAALCCAHLAAFRTATNMKKAAMPGNGAGYQSLQPGRTVPEKTGRQDGCRRKIPNFLGNGNGKPCDYWPDAAAPGVGNRDCGGQCAAGKG